MDKLNCMLVSGRKKINQELSSFIKESPFLALKKNLSSPDKIIHCIKKQEVDLVFLCVGKRTQKLSEQIFNQCKNIQIIYLADQKVPAISIESIRLNLPLTQALFEDTIQKILGIYSSTTITYNKYLMAKGFEYIHRIKLKDVQYLKSVHDHSIVYLNAKRYTLSIRLEELEKNLSHKDFLRIHPSYIIRKDKIQVIGKNQIIINEKTIPIGKTHKELFMKNFNEF